MLTRLRYLCALMAISAALAVSTVAASDSADQLLPVPQRSQLDGTIWAGSNCGPSSLAMILEAYGDRITNVALREKANKLLGISSPRTGTRIEDLALIAQERGLDVNGPDAVSIGKDQKRYRRWTLDEARAEIRAGHPVMVQVWLPSLPNQKRNPVPTDHYIVLTGTVGTSFVYNDPADSRSPGYQLKMTEAELKAAWSYSSAPFAAFSAGPGKTGKSLLPPPPPVASPKADPAPEPAAEAIATPDSSPAIEDSQEGLVVATPADSATDPANLENVKEQDGMLASINTLPGYSPGAGPEEQPAKDPAPRTGSIAMLPLSAALASVMVLGAILYGSRSSSTRKRARKLVQL